MRAVIQRVSHASVTVGEERLAQIERGLVVLLGVAAGDTAEEARKLAKKTAELRIFSDAAGRFDLSLLDVGGQALVVSQFTLLAATRKGRRPSFPEAAPPEEAEPLVEAFAAALREMGVEVQSGRFGAHMLVEIHNEGPVTIILDSKELDRPRRG
ncbi:MAG: D-aminoacyl-tRNA deacylase [Chloroflexota bacterium]|nr:D-aminoacyl-tRNA deacylase [Chloroflexota bacterium]